MLFLCCTFFFKLGNASTIAIFAGSSVLHCCATQYLNTVDRRCLTRLAVSAFVTQIGESIRRMWLELISATLKFPTTGKAYVSSVVINWAACFALRHVGRFSSWTLRAAASNLGITLSYFFIFDWVNALADKHQVLVCVLTRRGKRYDFCTA